MSLDELLAGIRDAKDRGDTYDEVVALRSQLETSHLPDCSFWLEWLSEAQERGNVDYTRSLFLRALESCPHYLIVTRFLDFLHDLHEDDKLSSKEFREAFEHSLTVCGQDIVTGCEIFKRFIDFEIDEHEALVDAAESSNGPQEKDWAKELSASKQRFIKLFHRQVSLPLIGNEACVVSFSKVLGELCVASDVGIIDPEGFQRKYKSGLEQREARLTFEMHVNSADFPSLDEANRASAWKAYIAFEVSSKQLGRGQRLYERAVLSCPTSEEVWFDFVHFAFSTLRNWKLTLSVTRRCLKVIRTHNVWLWKTHLMCVELSSGSSSSSEAVDSDLQLALTSGGLDSAQDFLDLLMVSCEVSHRRLRDSLLLREQPVEEEVSEAVSRLRSSAAYVEACLLQWFPDWQAGLHTLYMFWANAEHLLTAFQPPPSGKGFKPRGSEVWERALQCFPHSLFMFQEYIRWTKTTLPLSGDHSEASTACVDFCRRLVKRFVKVKFIDVSAETAHDLQLKEWLVFEQQWGTASEVQEVLSKLILSHRDSVLSKTTTAAPIVNKTSATTTEATVASSESKKRKAPAPVEGENDSCSGLKKNKHSEELSPPDQQRSGVTVRNLPFDASAEEVHLFVKQWCGLSPALSELLAVEVVLSKAGSSRGIVNVWLPPEAAAEEVRSGLHGREFKGRRLVAEIASATAAPRPWGTNVKIDPSAAGSEAAPHLSTVFVSRFSADVTTDQLRAHFSSCGEIVSAKVNVDKKTNQSKCNGLVQFVDEAGRTKALQLHKTVWGAEQILVAPSRFSIVAVAESASHSTLAEVATAAAPVAVAAKKPLGVASFKPRSVTKK